MSFSIDRDLYQGNPVPVRYDLVFLLEDEKPTFMLSACTNLVSEILTDDPLIKMVQEEFPGIGDFANSSDTLGFGGFGGIFKTSKPFLPLEGFSTWKARVPREVIAPKETDWNPANQLVCSLAVLMRTLEFAEAEPNQKSLQQLATHLMVCRAGMGGFGLAATLSPATRQWIASHRSQVEEVGRQTMIAVHEWMWPDYLSKDREFRLHNFRVWDNGQGNGFIMEIPGEGTSIYVDGMDVRNGPGWNLESHNVDSPVQQLSLLAGLCSILRMVRESQLT